MTVREGETHEVRYFCSSPPPVAVPPPPAGGYFVVNNTTDAALTVQVGGATHTVASGSSTIQLPVGSYTAVVSTRCGTAKETLTITAGSTHMAADQGSDAGQVNLGRMYESGWGVAQDDVEAMRWYKQAAAQ